MIRKMHSVYKINDYILLSYTVIDGLGDYGGFMYVEVRRRMRRSCLNAEIK